MAPPTGRQATPCPVRIDGSAKILSMMEDNKQLAHRIDGAVQSASQEVTNLRAELTATNRRLAELSGGGGGPGSGPGAATSASAAAVTVADSAVATMENHQHGAQAPPE
ncbi:Kazrin [Apodemus speciosus]|uniref:Kazrin n=1 Tax=Apodemus speciosus TaxID=105296 RepID=A0ABQ0EQ82_APOSI